MSKAIEESENRENVEQSEANAAPAEISKQKAHLKSFEWFYERNFDAFFQFIENKSEKTVLVRCLHCPPQKKLSVTINSAFNMNTHMKSTHPLKNEKYLDHTKKRKRGDVIPDDSMGQKKKQLKLDEFSNGGFINQAKLDRIVLNYIIDKVLPFSTVDCESFKIMVLTGKPSNLMIIHRNAIGDMLMKEFHILKNGMVDKYANIDYFCLTADMWSSRRRAFLGMTIHWICKESYARKKDVLACQRIKGIHSGDALAKHIDEIIKSFKVPIRKILKIITDGGSNFKKAFKDHQIESFQEEYDDNEDEDEALFEILNECESEQVFLPPHGKCASHDLCLVLTSDTKIKKPRKAKGKKNNQKKVEELTAFEVKYNDFRNSILDPVLKKCQDLFNKQSNSAKAADLVHSFLNRYLLTPSPTRWNSLHDSVGLLSKLIDENHEAISNVFTGLGLQKISPRDHAILKEYIKITENVADALDVLQGEAYMYHGVFSPTIHIMIQKINDMAELTYCEPLRQLILKSIEKRFPDYLKDDCLKAALLHPLFKNYPIFTASTKERLLSELAVELQDILDKSNTKQPLQEVNKKDRSDIENLKTFQRLFDYDVNKGFSGKRDGSGSSYGLSAERLLHNYLSDDSSKIESLKNYTEIGKLFIKYNTVLCSSAACERLFSLAKYVLRADRCQLKDEHFEAQLIMKGNIFPSKTKKLIINSN